MTRSRALGAALGVLVLLAACSRQEEVVTPAPAAATTFAEVRAEGDARFASGDWRGAIDAYRRALDSRPQEFAVRYHLAVALANLDQTEEAEIEFRWVVAHGQPEQEEVRIAEGWLEALTLPPPFAATAEATAEPGAGGSVTGRTQWTALEAGRGRLRVQILLLGDEPGAPARRRGAIFRLGDPYRFDGLKPGRYRLMAQVGGTRLWDTSVTVAAGQTTVLDLTPATSVAPADALRLQQAGPRRAD